MQYQKKQVLHFIFYISIITSSLYASSETLEEKGLRIAQTQKNADIGWVDSSSDMLMVLRKPSGRESQRIIKIQTLEVANDGDKSIMVFNSPKDVSGTAFLSYSHVDKPDDQWIYLPALKRVKRISSKKKSGSFMGSEFAYEDLSSFEVDKFTFKFIKDDTCGDSECFVLASYPKDPYSSYSYLLSWVDKKHYRVMKTEFYDKERNLLKILTVKKHAFLNEKYWRPEVSLMVNIQTGRETEIQWKNIKLKNGLKESAFNMISLKRSGINL